MGISRLDLYEQHLIEATLLHKALSHPARAKILKLIREERANTCLEFSIEIGLSQPAISQHLQILRLASLITFTTWNSEAVYSINYEVLDKLELNTIDYLNFLQVA